MLAALLKLRAIVACSIVFLPINFTVLNKQTGTSRPAQAALSTSRWVLLLSGLTAECSKKRAAKNTMWYMALLHTSERIHAGSAAFAVLL
jgi:hypothetical protein